MNWCGRASGGSRSASSTTACATANPTCCTPIERKGGGAPAWLYVLLEHDQTRVGPDDIRGELRGRIAQLAMMGGPAPGGRLEAQIGCGLPALDGRVVLTPYGTLALAAEDTRDYRAGARLDLQAFDLRLAGTRRESTGAAADHELTLRGGLRL